MSMLAIEGHATRGNEVIEILEMLGGKNNFYYDGTFKELIYTIGSELEIDVFNINSPIVKNDYIIFTLKEFIEKFPYKVGDKVIHDGEVLPIIGMKWDFSRNIVIYTLKHNYGTVDCYDITFMKPYKEETFGECIEKTINECLFGGDEKTIEGVYAYNEINCYHQDFGDKVRIRLGNDFEIKIEDNVTYIVKKQPQYPKTYEECCKVLDWNHRDYDRVGYKSELLCKLQVLILCRDAYWKLAGELMGLGKPWSPSKYDNAYCIFRFKGEIDKDNFVFGDSLMLEFPTEEMRDAFYKNFEDLIIDCKELL